MMLREESRTDLGTVKIYTGAIASIVDIAAGEIPGVKGPGRSFVSGLCELFGRKHHRIRVDFDSHSEVSLDVPIVVKYGYNVADVAARVQENVRAALEKATNLAVKTIDVHVQGIEKEAER